MSLERPGLLRGGESGEFVAVSVIHIRSSIWEFNELEPEYVIAKTLWYENSL